MTGRVKRKRRSPNPAGRPRSQELDRAILDAALRLARTQGYSAVTIERIATEAGVGKPSIYRRWKSKAEIVTAAVARQAEEDIPVQSTGSLRRDLHAALLGVARQLRTKDGKLVRSLFAEAQLDDAYRLVFQAFIAKRRRGIRQLIEAAMETGQINRDSDIDLIVDEVYGALLYRLLVGHAGIDDTFVRNHIEHVLAALTVPHKRPSGK